MINDKAGWICSLLLVAGSVHAQSVVIDGANIRVDASPSAKSAVTVKTPKSGSSKNNKVIVASGAEADSKASHVTVANSVAVASGVGVAKAGSGQSSGNGEKVFVNSDMSGQNLSRRNYAGASFTNVELVGTNFNRTDLSKAVMTNVDLSKADLRGANLAGAQMTNVDWEDALFEGATWVDGRRCGPGSIGKCK